MSRRYGYSIPNIYHKRRVCAVTYPTPTETLQGSPGTLLPVNNVPPGAPQYSKTLAAGDFPTFSLPATYTPVMLIALGGKNSASGGARTVNWSLRKNLTVITTGTLSVPDNNFWTVQFYRVEMQNVVAGDVLDCSLWITEATGTVYWDYDTFWIDASRISQSDTKHALAKVTVTAPGGPTLTGGTPNILATGAFYLFVAGNPATQSTSPVTALAYSEDATYRLQRINYGDSVTSTNTANSATQRPRYFRNRRPDSIILTELELMP